ncbi:MULTISPECIES: sigma-70 family RNA polymerase sigma factor [Mycobacterium avium complex (MAC)]|uniref:sigma-70 family RNA polymerase sigma factor n=1 Tax=Mycobacterium avium complex (MAC) TaxID=120793 RepID=UPI0009FBBCDD|nr:MULTISPECIES: sigma-70 family RNA polymerase sigma factor [Mycobacterium avium complex (MAC)]QWY63652.1 sigma-70 family RNA polymerase sigma factor [Mycobacterium avium subsp. hominissuis]
MNEPADAGPADGHQSGQPHPLLADPTRLQRITGAMYAAIHRHLFGRAGIYREERALPGGESADDVLQEALVALLKYTHAPNWEALSMVIAHGCAVDALRRATKGRRRRDAPDDEPDQISVSPFDEAIDEHTSAPARAWWDNPERAYEQHELLVALKPLIGALPEPARTIVVEVVMRRRTRVEVGQQLGLTGARVGQILAQSLLTLHEQVRRDPNFSGHIVERKKP